MFLKRREVRFVHEILDQLITMEDAWLEDEPQWREFVDDSWIRSMPGVVRLRSVAWALDRGYVSRQLAEGVIFSILLRPDVRHNWQTQVEEALRWGRTLTPAFAREVLGIASKVLRDDPFDEGLQCPQHRQQFETFRAYLQHFRMEHRQS
jgi:hypothetical protein